MFEGNDPWRTHVYYVYCSGDAASIELAQRLKNSGRAVIVRDIRKQNKDGKREWLIELMNIGLYSVPQVFNHRLEYLGDYRKVEETIFMPSITDKRTI